MGKKLSSSQHLGESPMDTKTELGEALQRLGGCPSLFPRKTEADVAGPSLLEAAPRRPPVSAKQACASGRS